MFGFALGPRSWVRGGQIEAKFCAEIVNKISIYSIYWPSRRPTFRWRLVESTNSCLKRCFEIDAYPNAVIEKWDRQNSSRLLRQSVTIFHSKIAEAT
jgi:hypothetical protein